RRTIRRRCIATLCWSSIARTTSISAGTHRRLPHSPAPPTDREENDTMKAYEAIAQSLLAEGVTDFFGLMGDGNMWLWGALCRDPSVKPYNARHESMAVSMADGYTRATGKIGVAMVTCGPGLTQCGTSLIAAYRGKTPLVLIAGEIEAGAKNRTQTMAHRRFVQARRARLFTITSHATKGEAST